MRRVLWGIVLAGLSSGSAQAKTYFATFEIPLTTNTGTPIPGATHIRVTLQNATPFVLGGCTTTATLWTFNDGANTPQTVVFGRGLTEFGLSSNSNTEPATLCRDLSGNVTKLDAAFGYGQPTHQDTYGVNFYFPLEENTSCFVLIRHDGLYQYSNTCVVAPVFNFTSH